MSSSKTLYEPRNLNYKKILLSNRTLRKSSPLKTSFVSESPPSLSTSPDSDDDKQSIYESIKNLKIPKETASELTDSIYDLSDFESTNELFNKRQDSDESIYQSTSDILQNYKEDNSDNSSDNTIIVPSRDRLVSIDTDILSNYIPSNSDRIVTIDTDMSSNYFQSDTENDKEYTASLETLVEKAESKQKEPEPEQKEKEPAFFTMKRLRSQTLWDTEKYFKELIERKKLTAEQMKSMKNEKKFCYLKPKEEISLGKETDFAHKYEILKFINADNQSCTYLTINKLHNEKMYLKQYHISNRTEYDILKIFKKQYKKICPRYFPCLKNAYETDQFIYLAYTINMTDNFKTLRELLNDDLSDKFKKYIKSELKNIIDNLLSLNIIQETSLDDILININNVSIINFNKNKAKIISNESKFNQMKIKSNYKKWFKKNILSNLE